MTPTPEQRAAWRDLAAQVPVAGRTDLARAIESLLSALSTLEEERDRLREQLEAVEEQTIQRCAALWDDPNDQMWAWEATAAVRDVRRLYSGNPTP